MTFKCEACLQEFAAQSSLLRHLSHKIICEDHYGFEKVDKMRFEAKMSSKRKWRQKKLAEDKLKYQKDKYEANADGVPIKKPKEDGYYSYVSESTRRKTFDGESFLKLFQSIYEEEKSKILSDLNEFLDEKFSATVKEDALDLTFTDSFQYEVAFNKQNPEIFEDFITSGEVEALVANNLEKAMETAFQVNCEKKLDDAKSEWINELKILFSKRCLKQTENFVFRNYFGKFQATTFLVIMEKALDETFNQKIDEIKEDDFEKWWKYGCDTFDEKLEWFLEEKCSDVLNELAKSSCDTNMENLVRAKICKAMKKQVDFLKSFD